MQYFNQAPLVHIRNVKNAHNRLGTSVVGTQFSLRDEIATTHLGSAQ